MAIEDLMPLLEHMPVGVIMLENERLTYINLTGLSILGAEKRVQVLGRYFYEFVHHEYRERIKEYLRKQFTEEFMDILAMKLVRLDREIADVQLRVIQTSLRGQLVKYITIEDLTECKRSQELLEKSDKLLILGELAAGIAHEIRNPLTSLKGFLQLIADNPAVNRTYSEIMLGEIERINFIVSELLLLAKPQKSNLEKVNLIHLLETVVTLLSAQAILHNVQIITHFRKNAQPIFICVENNKIKQAFINLIKNAIESMPEGGKVIILVNCNPEYVQVNIIDQGCGIPKDKLAKVGQAFFTTKEEGMGLGLMITKNIIEQHQGSLMIQSELGKGTIVEVNLPLK